MLTRKDIINKLNNVVNKSSKNLKGKEQINTILPKSTQNKGEEFIRPKPKKNFSAYEFIRPILPLKKRRNFNKNKKQESIQTENNSNLSNKNYNYDKNNNHLNYKKHHHKLNRHHNNPIIEPNKDNWWESEQVFNPGVIEIDGTIHMVYRSIGYDGESRLGYANSINGLDINFRLSYPIYKHKISANDAHFYNESGGSWGGCEDPRLVKVKGDDNVYMTYTAVDNGLRVGLTSIKADDLKNHRWKWTPPRLISAPNKVNKNWVIFPEKINGKYAIIHSIAPKISIEYRDSLNFKRSEYIESHYKNDDSRKNHWDSWVRGVGPPPIKTKYGWLIFYHAMDAYNPTQYLLGAMITDLKDPTKIIHRSKYPILAPDEIYENEGFKAGVIYASGAIIKDGNIIIYYGGADSYVCAAFTNLNEFLNKLMHDERITLKNKFIPKLNFGNINVNNLKDNFKTTVKEKLKRNASKK